MAAEVSAELGLINDEDVLRKMWQQTEDFGKKKEIRARMYKLREQRLKEFYTTDVASDIALTGRKHAATHHVDSIADQGFMSMKTKEIRDSESPTRDIHKRQSQNNYWNTVQESYSTADDGGRLMDTYEKSMSGQGVSPDGRTYSQSSANQKHQHSSNLEETENSTKIEDQQSRSSQAVVDAHTKTDNGDVYTKASKQEEQKKSSSYTTSKTGNTTYHSSSKQESSSSSSYTKQSTSTSTSNTYQILPSGERVLVSSTTVSNPRAISDETNSTSDSQNVSKYQDTTDFISTSKRDNQTSSTIASDVKRSENISNRYSENTKFISNETADVTSRNNDVKNSNQTYTTESTDRNVCDRRQTTQNSKVENESSNFVDQKIMSELHKLDSYLSTQNATSASTPVSPNSVTGDAANWTVVSSSDGEFVYKSDKERASPGDKPVLIKHPTSLELPKEATEGQYVTTYQQSYQPKKISVEHSPTHDAFARSLRTSPPPSNTRSSSKGSLDRSSPDRKFQKGGSPTRRSPDKERRVSVAGSYTIEKPKEVKRKVSEATYDIQKDTTVKAKRKFSTTQAKSISKVRSSTPGTSPSTSPTRMNRDRSSSSDSESDSSQLTYNKKTSTIKRSSSRKSPVNKDQSSPERSPTRKASSPTKSITQGRSTPESRPRPSSPTKSVPEKASSPSRKSPSPSNVKPSATSPERAPVRSPSPTKTTGILRKDSKSDSASTILIKSETVSKSDQITDETHATTTNTLKKKTEDDSQVSEFISKLKQEEETQKKAINSSQTKLTDTVDESNVDEDVNKMTYHTSDEITITKTSNTDEDEGVTEITTNNIDSSIVDRDSVREDSVSKNTSVSREDVVLSQGVVNNEVSKTETQDFIKNEKRGTTSPSCQPSFRDKSPEYSSEGSVTKEIKAARGIGKKNVSTPDSSPERSAFTPIKEFRTEPELKDKINVKVQPSKYPAGAPSPVSPRPSDKKAPDQSTKSRDSSPTKSASPSRSVSPVKQIKNKSPVRESKSSSVSPYSSPERSPTKKTKPADTHKPSSHPSKDTDKTKSVNQRTNRRSSIPRAENVTSVTRKVSEKKIELSSNKKPTTRVPSFEKRVPVQKTQNVRSDSQSSITRKTVTTRSDSQSSVTKKTVTKTVRSSSARDMNTQKSTTNTPTTKVKTTAIINLQRPSNKSLPVQKVANNVVNVTVTTKRKVNEAGPRKSQPIQSKPQTPKQATTRAVKKEVVQKTSQKTVHKDAYDGSSDRSTSVSSPETVKPVDVSATKKQSTVALSLICSSDVTSKQVKSHDFKSEIDVEDLEDELPPAEFLVDDYEDDEDRPVQQVKPSVTPKSAPKTQPKPGAVDKATPKSSPAKPSTTQNKSTLNKRVSNESLTTRNQSNKNVTAKTTVVKKDTVKSKANITLNNRSNVVASKVTPTPKSTPTKQRPAVPPKKKLVQDEPETSSSEDEETNIKENVSIITEDQQHYIDELEEIRQKEEQEYAAKLMATTNQEDSLLSVIVQLPKSSRESSPGHPAHSPFCAVSDDGGAHPRYADLVSEPEDVEVIDKTKLYESTSKRYEQVTDLDEESETEDLNVSVADRVSKFLATSQAVSSPKEAPEKPAESPKTERKEVLKAKHMFETIAKNQTAPPAPNNKPVDILSRPSVFEGRQGVTTPKDKFDTFPKTKATKSSESLNKTASTNDLSVENHETHVDIEENTSQQFIKNETTNVLKEIQIENIDSNTKSNKIITEEKKETTIRDKTRKTSSPEKEIQPRKSSIKDTPKKQAPAKYPGTENKEAKTLEIKESKISSKKDFFERKANAEKNTTLNKERPLRKEPVRPKKPSDTQVKSTDFIQNERKTSPSPRASPERKPVTKRPESPEVKRAQTKTVRENSSTEITTRKQSTERRSDIDRKSASSPTKERKDSPRASPDKQVPAKSPERSTPREKSPEKVATSSRPSSPTKKAPSPERKPSLKRASPEREAPSERKSSLKRTSPERDTPSERKSSLKRTSPEREAPSERKSSLKRTSPERKVSVETRRQSQERTVVVEQGETVELNKARRFGVTLKRTASTTSAATPRRSSTPGTEEIEDILQLELLEQMLEKAVGYETRRRIRAQIRIVKKMIEDGELQVTSSTSTRTTTTSKTTRSTKSPVKELESKPQTKPVDKKPETKKPIEQRPATPVQRPASPTKHKVEVSSLKSTFEKSTYEPSSKSTFEQKGAETTRAPSPSKPQDQQTVTRTETVKKTTRVETSSTNVRSQPREREPCPITSSYGVGPTDDEGRPLFGLKALRRSNTAKTLTDEPATADQPSEAPQSSKGAAPTEAVDGVFDARGRPLFGLRALQVSAQGDTPAEMPEVSSTQIRGLVNKHQQNARSSENEPQPRQKPKAKFRDSFILQDGETVEEALSQASDSTAAPLPQRNGGGASLRSLIQRHEDISSNGGTSHKEMESKTTVVTSKSVVSSDGSVSVNREVIKGELSSRNGEEPTGRIVHSKYSYQTPDDSNKSQGVSSTVTTTKTIGAGGRRSSGPKITELEDTDERRSSVSSSRRYSGAKVTEVEDEEERRGEVESTRGSSSECDSNLVSSVIKKFSGSKTAEADDKWQKSSSVTSKFVSTSSTSSTSRKANSTVTESKPKSFSPTPQQKSSDDDEDKKKPLVRGDSIRALQHKFQQATESAANGAPQRGYPPAGLILRTSSFKTTEESPNMSSSLKQHSTSSSTETKQRPNRTSSTSVTVRRNSKGDSSVEEKSVTSSSHTTTTSTATSRVASSEKTSFLDNTSRVTGVQDILQRMRNADLVVESGDTDEDTEARALLNKFLGASVILQGMEQGMKAAAKTNGHTPSPLSASSSPTSATLVSRVEKQRIASSNTNQLSEEELENIWDEKQLRNLLEACSDYEGRRRIRARLRAVMAEQKVCADVVAVAASDASGNSMLSQGELPVSILRSQSSQSSGVDDSGTESGEDLRLLSPEVLAEVQGALGKLETALPSLDPGRREALLQLVSRLQTCLQIPKPATPPNPPPRRFPRVARRSRHTVGVSREELADARRWLQETNPTPDSTPRRGSETLTNESLVSKVFRPVKFNPIIRSTSEETYFESSNPLEEHPIIEQHFNPILYKAEVQYMSQTQPLLASVSYVLDKNTERLMGDATGSSILEYDPSSVLFTPEQSVQIAVHKAAINKQIFSKEEEKRREDSDDEEFSSTEDDHHLPTNSLVSSAQRLLLMASDNRKVSSSNLNRFHTKNNKKMKMKRANTIDIPKPQNYYDVDGSSCDEFDRNSVDDGNLSDNNKIYRNNHSNNSNRKLPFTLEPKTANDFKFLAFLQQTSERENNAASYNPCARGGAQWSNRFSNIKTAFEPGARRQSNPNVSSVNKSMWHNLEQQQKQQQSETDKRHTRTPQPIQKKLPWTNNSSSTSHQNENVVIGSITVAKKTPGPINQFSHAPKSAFKPPEKKTIPPVQPYNPPSASGTVKLLASQKFSGQNPSPKPILKQYPPQDKILNSFKPKSTNKDVFQKQPDDCRGFVPYTKLHHEVTQVPKVTQPVEKVDNNSQIKPYYIQPQKIENHRVSKVVKSLESEKINEVAPVPPPKPTQSHHVFKHHLVKIPDESFNYSAPMNSNLYDRLTPEVSSINNRPFMDDKITNYRSNYEDNEDRYPQTHFIPASPPIQNPSNLYIPHSLPDTGYSSSSLKSNSSFEYSPSSPNRVANNCFPHNFSPQRTGGVLESRTSSIENELNIASDAISPLPSQYYVGQVQNNLLRIPSNLPTGRSSKTSSIDEDESASASPSFWANEEVSKIINPCDQMESQTAVTRVMGQPHTAVTVTNKMRHRHESAARKIESHILSAAANPSSPSFPNVLQKSESWHQMVKEKMAQAKQAPPLPKIPKAKSSHALAFPKQFEAAQPKELLQSKQSTVDQYLKKSKSNAGINKLKERRSTTKVESTTSIRLDEDLRNVDEAFESLFNETSKRRSNK